MAGLIFYDFSQSEPLRMAASILNEEVGQIYNCPRFLYPAEEGVEEIRKLLSALSTADDKERVLYFADADVLNVSCQNALLKTLEDRDDVVCIFVGTKKLLDTIESRCQVYRCRIPSREEFYKDVGVEDSAMPWLYAFCKGHTDVAGAVVADGKLCNVLNRLQAYHGPESMDKGELFRLFSMMKEKDPDCFFEKYKEYIPNLYAMISALLFKAEATSSAMRRYKIEDLLGELVSHMRRARASRSYSKNDFFEILARM